MAPINKLLPEAPYDGGRASPEYPWYSGEAGRNGHRKIINANPEKPKESYIEHLNHDGSFSIVEAADEGMTNEFHNHTRKYNSGGSSENTDGNAAEYGQSNKNVAFVQDVGLTAGNDIYRGAGNKEISGTYQGSFNNNTEGPTYSTSNGDVISEHTGDIHSSNDGDEVHFTNGNKYNIVTNDSGINITNGNYDIKVNGKTKIHSGNEIIIESDTKITLKVGSSEIVITPTDITITAPGDIITLGATTKIQGGGSPPADPRTFI